MDVVATPKRYDCLVCHKTYSRKFDLGRHTKRAHPETDESEDSEYLTIGDEMPVKKRRLEEVTDDDGTDEENESDGTDNENESVDEEENDESDDAEEGETEDESSDTSQTEDPEDNQGYQDWLEHAMTETEEKRNAKYDKYISEGMTEEEAREKAHVKVLWAVKRIFFDHYSNFLRQNVHLEKDETHQEIMDDLQSKLESGIDVKDALSRALVKHKTKFEGLFNYQSEDSEDENEEETSDED